MKSVNIAELKNRLSSYLNRVKAGEEIVIRDRDRPVARIVPLLPIDDEDAHLASLAARGLIRLGQGPMNDEFWKLPAPKVSAAILRRAVTEERDEN
ncbi:MAG TPA: type II toxin-antitoxin system prevent-host-death family antitoxin [Pyrinomonadaceae bacterium]|nr:type II toxin-antitoxin system prevent-host-death family antitoxin [Pyrinomonadaceae bacterium]